MVVAVANVQNVTGLPRPIFPVLGSLAVGLIALAYPEILYWGFENVDTLLETRPFIRGLSVDLLLQLVGVKIVATSLCRAAGLVGGYYAPSLFIGAATGMAYGKFINFAISKSDSLLHLSLLEVASPQAYGLVCVYHGKISYLSDLLFCNFWQTRNHGLNWKVMSRPLTSEHNGSFYVQMY